MDSILHRSIGAFHLQWCRSKFVSAGSSTFDFFSCFSLVGLFLLNLLILRDSRLTSLGTAVSCWCQCKWRQQAGALHLFNFLVMSGFQRQKVRILLKPYLICSIHHRPPQRCSSQVNMVKVDVREMKEFFLIMPFSNRAFSEP